jgi:hypothetical protein
MHYNYGMYHYLRGLVSCRSCLVALPDRQRCVDSRGTGDGCWVKSQFTRMAGWWLLPKAAVRRLLTAILAGCAPRRHVRSPRRYE